MKAAISLLALSLAASLAGQAQRPQLANIRQENGAYCPLFLPLGSSHERPSAFTWLLEARASAKRLAAG